MTIAGAPEGTNCSIAEGVPAGTVCLGNTATDEVAIYLAVDPATNDVYYSDSWEGRVRKIDGKTQAVTTVAGRYGEADWNQYPENNPNLPATSAVLGGPQGVALHNGLVYITDTMNVRIRVVNTTANTIRTVAGNGELLTEFNSPEENIPATSAKLRYPVSSVVFDQAGSMFFIDGITVRKVDGQTGLISTVVNTQALPGETRRYSG